MAPESIDTTLAAAYGADGKPVAKRCRVLHMLGSPASDYYCQLSTMYARGCVASNEASCADEFEFVFAVVQPQGPTWCFPANLDADTIDKSRKYGNAEGVTMLANLQADVCQSHMFCVQGVSTYRALLDFLNVPFVGGSVDAMALTTHKARSKAVVEQAGVPVPAGEVLHLGERPRMKPPYILKPCSEDNSMGVSVVHTEADVDAALIEAFKFDDEVLCEQYIPPGREIRFGVLEDQEGKPTVMLPGVEYFMSKERPIRTSNDKLVPDASGKLTFANPSRACPAEIDDALLTKLSDAVCRAHVALGCRDYSLYDFRIDTQGEIYFLEASLFCCFAPNSVISLMCDASGEPHLKHQEVFKSLLRRAAARKVERSQAAVQELGSKVKRTKVETRVAK